MAQLLNSFVFRGQTVTWEIGAALTVISHFHLCFSFPFSLPSFLSRGVGWGGGECRVGGETYAL